VLRAVAPRKNRRRIFVARIFFVEIFFARVRPIVCRAVTPRMRWTRVLVIAADGAGYDVVEVERFAVSDRDSATRAWLR
jgi:hypothetical protein